MRTIPSAGVVIFTWLALEAANQGRPLPAAVAGFCATWCLFFAFEAAEASDD